MRFKLDKEVHSKLKAQAAIAKESLENWIISILTDASNQNGKRRDAHKSNVG